MKNIVQKRERITNQKREAGGNQIESRMRKRN